MSFDDEGKYFIYCIVANIIGKHYYGEDKRIKQGTRHFRSGAKVICNFEWKSGKVIVTGKSKNGRYRTVIMNPNMLKNFRVAKIYTPQIIKIAKKNKLRGVYCYRIHIDPLRNELTTIDMSEEIKTSLEWTARYSNDEPNKEISEDDWDILLEYNINGQSGTLYQIPTGHFWLKHKAGKENEDWPFKITEREFETLDEFWNDFTLRFPKWEKEADVKYF